MRTRKAILFGALCVTCMVMKAQDTTDWYQNDLENVNAVVLTLDGNVRIIPSSDHQIKVNSTLRTEGKVRGIKIPKQRPEFQTHSKLSNDTLYVKTAPVFSYSTIGINTYKESIETNILLAANMTLIVNHSNNLTLESGFTEVCVREAKSITLNSIEKTQFKSLICKSAADIVINGMPKGNSFEFMGIGLQNYDLNAHSISLTIR